MNRTTLPFLIKQINWNQNEGVQKWRIRSVVLADWLHWQVLSRVRAGF